MSESMRIFSLIAGQKAADTVVNEFKRIIKALGRHEYAVIGAMALSQYITPRATADMDILLLEEDLHEVRSALEKAGFSLIDKSDRQFVIKSKVDYKFSFEFLFCVGFNPEGAAIDTAQKMTLMGVPGVRVAKPMYLAWLLSTTELSKHATDLRALVDAKLFRVTDLLDEIEHSLDPSAKKRLLKVINKKAMSVTLGYTETWEQYQARRTPPGWETIPKHKRGKANEHT